MDQHLTELLMLKDSCDEAQKPFPTHGPSHLPTKKKQASIHNQHLNYLYIASQQLNSCLVIYKQNGILYLQALKKSGMQNNLKYLKFA